MLKFLVRRMLHSILVLLGVLFVVHGLLLLTGDPTAALLPPDADEEVRENLRRKLGLDDPFPVQYVKFVGRAVQGNFGDSFRQARPAFEFVSEEGRRDHQTGCRRAGHLAGGGRPARGAVGAEEGHLDRPDGPDGGRHGPGHPRLLAGDHADPHPGCEPELAAHLGHRRLEATW